MRAAPKGQQAYPLRGAYYGDLQLHTSYSLDAYLQGDNEDRSRSSRITLSIQLS